MLLEVAGGYAWLPATALAGILVMLHSHAAQAAQPIFVLQALTCMDPPVDPCVWNPLYIPVNEDQVMSGL
jgi:hypothetical protein